MGIDTTGKVLVTGRKHLTKKLRTLYLQRLLSVNGRECLGGRVLYNRFKAISEESHLGHLVVSDEDAEKIVRLNPELGSDIVSLGLFQQLSPNIIFVEGGLFSGKGQWKIPKPVVQEAVSNGAVVIVADVAFNEIMHDKVHYKRALDLFGAFADYGPSQSDSPIYACDRKHYWQGYRQILCKTEKMAWVSDWLKPIYEGIPEVLAGNPVKLSELDSRGDILASCNQGTTGTLHQDIWVDDRDSCPFAAVNQVGSGFAVLIAASVSNDVWLAGCPHNTAWLTNIASFLVEKASEERTLRASPFNSPHCLFLSHRTVNKVLVEPIDKELRRIGFGTWYDAREVVPSMSLPTEISKGLDRMSHFVLFWSTHCVGARWVEQELDAAVALLIEKHVPILIIRLDETPVPSILAGKLYIGAQSQSAAEIAASIADAVERLSRNS